MVWAWLAATCVWFVGTIIIWTERRSERFERVRRAWAGAVVCPACRYDLTGATALRCPECGREFTIEQFVGLSLERRLGGDPVVPNTEYGDADRGSAREGERA